MNTVKEDLMKLRQPLTNAIRAAALADDATPTDRLAAAVLLLAIQIHETGELIMEPQIITQKIDL